MINPLTKTTIFYHATPRERLSSILSYGLRTHAAPTWYKEPKPYIWLSTVPFFDYLEEEKNEGFILLEVDLSKFEGYEGYNESEFSNHDWQFKLFQNIEKRRISISELTMAQCNQLCDAWEEQFPE